MTYKVLQNRAFRGRTFFAGQRLRVAETPSGDEEIPPAFVAPMLEAGLITSEPEPKPGKKVKAGDAADPP